MHGHASWGCPIYTLPLLQLDALNNVTSMDFDTRNPYCNVIDKCKIHGYPNADGDMHHSSRSHHVYFPAQLRAYATSHG